MLVCKCQTTPNTILVYFGFVVEINDKIAKLI